METHAIVVIYIGAFAALITAVSTIIGFFRNGRIKHVVDVLIEQSSTGIQLKVINRGINYVDVKEIGIKLSSGEIVDKIGIVDQNIPQSGKPYIIKPRIYPNGEPLTCKFKETISKIKKITNKKKVKLIGYCKNQHNEIFESKPLKIDIPEVK